MSLRASREIIEVAHGHPFCVFLTNLSQKQVSVPKHTIVAHTEERLQAIAPNETTLLEAQPNTIAAVHNKPSLDRDTQMSLIKAIKQDDNEKLKANREDKVQILRVSGYRVQLLDILTEL